MVITDIIAREGTYTLVFSTLDTGLLHQDTLNLLDNLEKDLSTSSNRALSADC